LWARAREVVPRLAVIASREGTFGPALLASLGVPKDRILVTGDDAVELAYTRRRPHLGTGLGVNLRVADYAGTTPEQLAALRPAVLGVARACAATLVPVPVSRNRADSDSDSLRCLLQGQGHPVVGAFEPDGPEQLIDQIGHCRLVVTGSYHAAVFALSQGIPAVCLVRSPYYAHKFLGLQGLFPAGTAVLNLDERGFSDRLLDRAKTLWVSADSLRSSVLAAAAEQVEASRRAYEHLFTVVDSDRGAAKGTAPPAGGRDQR
jgi:colanic acid/amylovoran biosynthesis protein